MQSAKINIMKDMPEPDYEPEGREFDSLRARHFFNRYNAIARAPDVLPTSQEKL
jgi:hypothetical protein